MIRDCGLRAIPSKGCKFSWGGERNKEWIQCCLDRALANEDWFRLFPRVSAEFFERVGSDYRPLFLRFTNENMSHQGRFMFDKRWAAKPETLEIIKKGWNIEDRDGSTSILDRIANCLRGLSRWKRTNVSNSKTKIKIFREQLEKEGTKQFPNLSQPKMWRWELADAYREEELYWKLISKEKWLKDGDQNTSFFHGSV
ncbi:hypothetical protein V5N11_007112 [Cardamine amara subsp. amara]|uniref:Reverse transcriptase n=1 Tax=Cardamine amara subsp. amara TaxID=228776 RepID=A0ABD0ZE02_CARAN